MKKELSLIFFIRFINGKREILMGKKGPNQRLAGVRNGFGGKCEFLENENRLETQEECVIREIVEETKGEIKVEEKDLIKAGKIVDQNRDLEVGIFYVFWRDEFPILKDNEEFLDIRWFDVDDFESYVPEMMRTNETLAKHLANTLIELEDFGKIKNEFTVDETHNLDPELNRQKQEIFAKR
jgi:8-oxo-dGTP pyrophosphatase MutT (NUDIX family)